VTGCCSPEGYRRVFSERNAGAEARRYRRRGLDTTSRRIFELLVGRGVEGRTLLEVGGGIGALQIELLKAGLARAVSVELTPTYEATALALLREGGLDDRVERRVMDLTTAGAEVEGADIVVLNRVLCCYPDMPRLAGAAAARTRRTLVLSFPDDRWWTRLAVALANVGMRTTRRGFRLFLHRPASIRATAERHGLATAVDRPGRFWRIAAFERRG
jgi:magnesium-protoporphyrin O-methyltransferase